MSFVRFQSKFHQNRTIFRPHMEQNRLPIHYFWTLNHFRTLNGQKVLYTLILYIICQVSVQISSKSDNIQTSYEVKHAPHTLLVDPEPFQDLERSKVKIYIDFVHHLSSFSSNFIKIGQYLDLIWSRTGSSYPTIGP